MSRRIPPMLNPGPITRQEAEAWNAFAREVAVLLGGFTVSPPLQVKQDQSGVGHSLDIKSVAQIINQYYPGSLLPVIDTTPIVYGSSDSTKIVRLEADTLIPTGTTVVVTIPSAATILPVATQQFTYIGPTSAHTYTLPDSAASLAAYDVAQTWSAIQTYQDGKLKLNGATSGTAILLAPATGGGTLTLPAGTDSIVGVAASQALVNKTYNGNTFTAGTGTLTIGAGKTLTASNSIALAGTDGSTLNVGAGGTLGTAAFASTGSSGHTLPYLDVANVFSQAQTTRFQDAGTNTTPVIAAFSHNSSATPDVGFGGLIQLLANDSTTDDTVCAGIRYKWRVALDASQRGVISLEAADNTDYREGIAVGTSGTAALVGFFGATPVAKQSGDLATGIVSLGLFSSVTITATSSAAVTIANEGTDTTCFPLFATAATGDLGPKTNAALTFNSNTGALGATSFTATSFILLNSTASDQFSNVLNNGTTNVATDVVFSLHHNSTGSVANGFGLTVTYNLEDSVITSVLAASDVVSWVDKTEASRKSRRTWNVNDAAASREIIRGEASGSAGMIGFLGAAATAAQASPDIGSDYVTRGLATGTPTFACANLTGTISNSQLAFPRNYILLQDQETKGTDGGTFTSGAWRTRTLNTEVADTGSECSLSSNQFTLTAGTYEIHATAPGAACVSHQTRLQNVTDATTVLTGTSEWCGTTVQSRSVVSGRFTIAASKALELQHQCTSTHATNGLGVNANLTTEVYAEVELRRIA